MDLVAASVAAARHCRLVESHGLWAYLTAAGTVVAVDDCAQGESVGSGVCACSGESTRTGAHVGVLGDGRGMVVLPRFAALTFAESGLSEYVNGLGVTSCGVFCCTETRLACLIHSPADGNDAEQGSAAKTCGKADAGGCCAVSAATVAVVAIAAVIAVRTVVLCFRK